MKASIIGLEDGAAARLPAREGRGTTALLLSTLRRRPVAVPLRDEARGERRPRAPAVRHRSTPRASGSGSAPTTRCSRSGTSRTRIDDGAGFLATCVDVPRDGRARADRGRPPRAHGRRASRPGNRGGFELNLVHPGPLAHRRERGRHASRATCTSGTTEYRWTPEEMTYLRWPNPNNRWYGQGRLAAVRQAHHGRGVRGHPRQGLREAPRRPARHPHVQDAARRADRAELQRRWENAVGGYRNAGKIAVLGSKTTYQAIAANARDAQWGEQRQAPPGRHLHRLRHPARAHAHDRRDVRERRAGPRRALGRARSSRGWSRFAGMVTRSSCRCSRPSRSSPASTSRASRRSTRTSSEVVDIAAGDGEHRRPSPSARCAAACRSSPSGTSATTAILHAHDDRVVDRPRGAGTGSRSGASRESPRQSPPAARETAHRTPRTRSREEDATETEDRARAAASADRPRGPSQGAAARPRARCSPPSAASYAADLASFFAAQRGALRPIAKAQPHDDDLDRRGPSRSSPRSAGASACLRISRGPVETAQTLGAIRGGGIGRHRRVVPRGGVRGGARRRARPDEQPPEPRQRRRPSSR